MKYFLLVFLFFLSLSSAKDIKPTFVIETKGFVMDFVIDGSNMYIANDAGSIEVFDFSALKIVNEIVLPLMKTTKGSLVTSKVLSVDRFNGKTLIVSTTLKGYREVYIHDGITLNKIIKKENKLTVNKAKFIDENNFILGTVGHEVISYNLGDNYIAYRRHIEESTFTDVAVSADKKTMITSSESGRVSQLDVKTGKIINSFESENVDKIYKVGYSNGVIITAGQDRRVAIYKKGEKPYHIKSNFLVYCTALSPSAKRGVYSSDEDHNLQVFDIKTKEKTDRLIGHYSTPTTIKFVTENELFSSGDEKKVFYWKLF